MTKWYDLLNTWSTPVSDMELVESDDGVLSYNDDGFGWLSIKIRCPNFVVAKELRKRLEERTKVKWSIYDNNLYATINSCEEFVKLLHESMRVIVLDKNGRFKKHKIIPPYLPAGACIVHDAITDSIDPLTI